MKVFTTSDISRLYGFTQRQLDSWDRSGLVKPSARKASGKGSVRLYALEDLLAFRFVKRLMNAGWNIRSIKAAVNNLRSIFPEKDPLRDLILLDINGTIIARCSTENGETMLLDALSAGQLVMAFTLSGLWREVDKDVKQLVDEVM